MRKFLFGFVILAAMFSFVNPYAVQAESLIKYEGYAQIHYYPAHNEFDPNPGVDFKDRVVSRYGSEFALNLRLARFPRLFVFGEAKTYFGDSRPQISYNHKVAPIVTNAIYGVGYELVKNKLEIRAAHGEWYGHGDGYKGERLLWSSIGLRYNFGNR